MKRPELKGQLVCMECGHVGLPDTFPCPCNAPGILVIRFCPHCHEKDIRPADQVEWCEQCQEYPASNIVGSQNRCDICNAERLDDDGREDWRDDWDDWPESEFRA